MKLIFAGTPEFSVPTLRALLSSEHEVLAVYTQPDRPAGRGQKLKPGAVKRVALDNHLEVRQPLTLNSPEERRIIDQRFAHVDAMIVVAYGLMIPEALLSWPRLGCINIHPSKLPHWRGAAPIVHALLQGQQRTAITIMQMDKGMDSGPILSQTEYDILSAETAGELHDRLAIAGAECLLTTLSSLQSGQITPQAQQHEQATYTRKMTKADAKMDWSLSVDDIVNRVRAFNPWPIVFSFLGEQSVRLWRASALSYQPAAAPGTVVAYSADGLDVACADGVVRVTQLQLPGAKALLIADFFNSKHTFFQPGKSVLV